MEFLRRALKQIKAQLGTLTTSQRLVIILLLVIMVGAIVWMVNYSRRREMVPLLNQPFTEEERKRIVNTLDARQTKFIIEGERILVPKEEQREIIGLLGYKGLLPRDTSLGWSLLLEDTDVFAPESVRKDKKLIAKQMELAYAIATWPGVEEAQVFINEGGNRRLGMNLPPTSASVMVRLEPGVSAQRHLALAIAEFVSGANARMKRENVKVIANGQRIPIPAEGEEFGSEYLVVKAQTEERYRDKIISVLPVADALVQVDVTLQNTKSEKQTTSVAEEGKGTLIYSTEETTDETSQTNVSNQQEPGVIANAVLPSPTGAATQNETSEESSRSKQAIPGTTKIFEVTPAGGITDITATVGIPLSYFENMAKSEAGGDQEKEPDPALVQQITDREIPKIKKSVMLAVGLVGPEYENNVAVDTYWADGSIASSASLLAGGSGAFARGGLIGGLVHNYGKHIAISALALLSLFMVLMMVRKAAGPVEMEETAATTLMGRKKPLEALSLEESNLDDETDSGLLTGLELDSTTVRTQQMLEQIKEMVKGSPETAASLIRKWIKRKE